MKKTVLEVFNELPDGELKRFVFANLDERYLEEKVFTLKYALTFGVKCPEPGNFKFLMDNS
jgi:hypothetical protein